MLEDPKKQSYAHSDNVPEIDLQDSQNHACYPMDLQVTTT